MSSALVVKVFAGVGIQMIGSPGLGQSSFSLAANDGPTVFKTGSGNGTASSVFASERTLSASASETHNLTSGLTDPTGAALAFTNIKGIFIQAALTNGANIVIGDAASHAFDAAWASVTDVITLKPGAQILITDPAGWPVVAATNDQLKVANTDSINPAQYTIILFG